MNAGQPKTRVVVEAALERSVISGTMIAPTGERRDFHGFLELATALEAALAPTRDDRHVNSTVVTTRPIPSPTVPDQLRSTGS